MGEQEDRLKSDMESADESAHAHRVKPDEDEEVNASEEDAEGREESITDDIVSRSR